MSRNEEFDTGRRREVYNRANFADGTVTSYNVSAALDLVKDRAADTHIPVEPLADAITFGRAIDEDHAKTVDSTKPVLLASFPNSHKKELIDGWHRAWKAHTEGKTHIPAITLTPEETSQIISTKNI
jgi:hypothetical protein